MNGVYGIARRVAIGVGLALSANGLMAQFDAGAYGRFLKEHREMTTEQFLQEYPAGQFRATAPVNLQAVQYFDAVDAKLRFTEYEKQLARMHGFVVTERLSFDSYLQAFMSVYESDLPLYISTDAILHALHRSYDNILADVERYALMAPLGSALRHMATGLQARPVSADPMAHAAAMDADVYVTVAQSLLTDSTIAPVFAENADRVRTLLSMVAAERVQTTVIFGTTPRIYDFSQCKPRGHYTKSSELSRYFRTMMWLGRSEVYITSPKGEPAPTNEEVRQQCMMAVILADMARTTPAEHDLGVIDATISRFVGEQDNLSLTKLIGVVQRLDIAPEALANDGTWKAFQKAALEAGGQQQILSQVLMGNPFDTEKIEPAAAFMLLGQRFILDSYVLGNVVHDKVRLRMMPNPLDAMFVLGNDAAAQLLVPELTQHAYGPQLAGLRYLASTLDSTYWKSSLYAGWLDAIRSLNPPSDRSQLPAYMQTGAWWQKTLNTQLTSWAELRHDNLLYAKQSYTGGITCFYPDGYVEPVPQFYSTVSDFARNLKAHLATAFVTASYLHDVTLALDVMENTCHHLESMASKELRGEGFSEDETALIEHWIFMESYCGATFDGTYAQMMYGVHEDRMPIPNFVIADVHTQPTDEAGNPVGKVLHIGTGKLNLALVMPTDPNDGCTSAYVGPVGSFYQHITDDFTRLTDEEWVELYGTRNIPRPAWVNTYLANADGSNPGQAQTLSTSVYDDVRGSETTGIIVTPNPTSGTATIAFVVAPSQSGKNVSVQIVNERGERIALLMDRAMDAGNYLTHWHADASTSGTYYAHITIDGVAATQVLSVVK